MISLVDLTLEERQGLLLLKDTLKNDSVICFILELNRVFSGLSGYLPVSEMPVACMQQSIQSHGVVLSADSKRYIKEALVFMPFFKVGVISRVSNEVWNPTSEPLSEFSIRNFNKEVVCFEQDEYKKIVEHFQEVFEKQCIVR